MRFELWVDYSVHEKYRKIRVEPRPMRKSSDMSNRLGVCVMAFVKFKAMFSRKKSSYVQMMNVHEVMVA